MFSCILLFPALSVYPQVGISLSASETDDTFYLSQYQYFCTACATKHFKDHNKKLDHTEVLSLSILRCIFWDNRRVTTLDDRFN